MGKSQPVFITSESWSSQLGDKIKTWAMIAVLCIVVFVVGMAVQAAGRPGDREQDCTATSTTTGGACFG